MQLLLSGYVADSGVAGAGRAAAAPGIAAAPGVAAAPGIAATPGVAAAPGVAVAPGVNIPRVVAAIPQQPVAYLNDAPQQMPEERHRVVHQAAEGAEQAAA